MRIQLRHMSMTTDIDMVFSLFTDSETQPLIVNHVLVKTREDFAEWFHFQLINHYQEFRIIEADGSCAGFCYSYDYHDGSVKTVVCTLNELRNKGIGALAELIFIDYLFCTYPLRKIYNHIFSYNETSLKANIDGGFQIEAILKEYRYYNGAYHDLYILSLSRDAFYNIHKNSIMMLRKKD